MVYMNRKEGTGVRARSDLTANALPGRIGAISDDELRKTINVLTSAGNAGTTLYLKPEMSLRLADVLIETLNRSPNAQ